jgi:hypothetical protein
MLDSIQYEMCLRNTLSELDPRLDEEEQEDFVDRLSRGYPKQGISRWIGCGYNRNPGDEILPSGEYRSRELSGKLGSIIAPQPRTIGTPHDSQRKGLTG